MDRLSIDKSKNYFGAKPVKSIHKGGEGLSLFTKGLGWQMYWQKISTLGIGVSERLLNFVTQDYKKSLRKKDAQKIFLQPDLAVHPTRGKKGRVTIRSSNGKSLSKSGAAKCVGIIGRGKERGYRSATGKNLRSQERMVYQAK